MSDYKTDKKRIDSTSLVMLIVFFAIIIGALVAIGVVVFNRQNGDKPQDQGANASYVNIDGTADEYDEIMNNLTPEQIATMFPDAQPGSTYSYVDDDGNLKEITIPADYKNPNSSVSIEDAVASSKYKFENYTDLTDKFMEVCSEGNVDELYHLYFPGFLEDMRLNMEQVPTKEVFDANMSASMKRVTGFNEYEYGSPELSHAGSPGSYSAFIYGQVNGGKQIPLDLTKIEDCVNLVTYDDNMYESNHFMVKIGGYWYFIV